MVCDRVARAKVRTIAFLFALSLVEAADPAAEVEGTDNVNRRLSSNEDLSPSALLTVVEGAEYCELTEGGTCVTDGVGSHAGTRQRG